MTKYFDMHFQSSCSGCFAGLSCGTRVEIIQLLQKSSSSKGRFQPKAGDPMDQASGRGLAVSEIAKHFKTTQPTISHHLKYLKDMGILTSRRLGRQIFYAVDPKCGWDKCEVFS